MHKNPWNLFCNNGYDLLRQAVTEQSGVPLAFAGILAALVL